MAINSLKPKQFTKKLLSVLPERARAVLASRYGLDSGEKKTLESIGEKYGITRERVRQIENYSIEHIKKSDFFRREQAVFLELERLMRELGSVLSEDELLDLIAKKEDLKNHIHLYLVLGEAFRKEKEDEDFKDRWHVDGELSNTVHTALRSLYGSLEENDLIPESEILAMFKEHLKQLPEKHKEESVLRRWLGLSKRISRNPLGEWGVAHSPGVRAKGIRDLAYLAIRRHGSPMHFTEVAKVIGKMFEKRAHVATCHNELIKDPRFVLVGRGLYALSEWGYSTGVVRDVIRDVLKKNGPMTREEVIQKVLKERYVKPNTIIVNLQNPQYFRKDSSGKYSAVA